MAKAGRSLAERIKASREKAGLSQMEAANRAGMTLSGITKIEQGLVPDPRWWTLVRLARALDADLSDWAEADEPSDK